ncbi:MAG TPA: hypothetical protein P5055_10820, partial [Candidatus Paceibacterota bacterium]|nr:hypothetical protein [Candidatus Paceibacterota bacterium]
GPGGPALPHPVGPAVRPYPGRRARLLNARLARAVQPYHTRSAQRSDPTWRAGLTALFSVSCSA